MLRLRMVKEWSSSRSCTLVCLGVMLDPSRSPSSKEMGEDQFNLPTEMSNA